MFCFLILSELKPGRIDYAWWFYIIGTNLWLLVADLFKYEKIFILAMH